MVHLDWGSSERLKKEFKFIMFVFDNNVIYSELKNKIQKSPKNYDKPSFLNIHTLSLSHHHHHLLALHTIQSWPPSHSFVLRSWIASLQQLYLGFEPTNSNLSNTAYSIGHGGVPSANRANALPSNSSAPQSDRNTCLHSGLHRLPKLNFQTSGSKYVPSHVCGCVRVPMLKNDYNLKYSISFAVRANMPASVCVCVRVVWI